MRLFKRRDPNRCRVDEEWCGSFIGRRYCSTHNVVWDNGGACPSRGLPPSTEGLWFA